MEISNDFLLFFFLFTIFFIGIGLYSTYRLKNKIDKKIIDSQNHATISYQREQIENDLYLTNSRLTSSLGRFEDTNGLMLTIKSDIRRNHNVRDDSFFSELGIDINSVSVEENMAMCLMPFHKTFDKVYTVIKYSCQTSGFKCTRSDDEFVRGNILRHTVELILKSELLIAVMDGRNPNVAYEIGIAHALGKTVILVADFSKLGEIPVNLKSNRFILYKNYNDLHNQLNVILSNLKS